MHLDGGIATAVEDLSRSDALDLGHVRARDPILGRGGERS